MRNIILYIFIFFAVYFLFFNKTECLENIVDQEKMKEKKDVATQINDFLKTDTNFRTYIDFLNKLRVKSYNLIKQETFFELKFLKRQNTLTVDTIVSYMNDY